MSVGNKRAPQRSYRKQQIEIKKKRKKAIKASKTSIYCDGSFYESNNKAAWAFIVYIKGKGPRYAVAGSIDGCKDSTGIEVYALRSAISYAHSRHMGKVSTIVYSDSKHAIGRVSYTSSYRISWKQGKSSREQRIVDYICRTANRDLDMGEVAIFQGKQLEALIEASDRWWAND